MTLQDWIASDIEARLRPRTPIIFEDVDSTKIIPGIKADAAAIDATILAAPEEDAVEDNESIGNIIGVLASEASTEEISVPDVVAEEAPVEEAPVEATTEATDNGSATTIIAPVFVLVGDVKGESADEVKAESADAEKATPVVIDSNVENVADSAEPEKENYSYMPKIIEDHDLTVVVKAQLPEEGIDDVPPVALDLSGIKLAHAEEISLESVDPVEGRISAAKIARADAVTTGEVAPIDVNIARADVVRAESKVLETTAPIKGKIIETTIVRAESKEISDVDPVNGRLANTTIARAEALATH